MHDNKRVIVPYLIWLLPLSFFTYQFILRLFPSLIMQQIYAKFSVDATAFGLLASVYYYGYAGFQIPFAILLDRYKPGYIIFCCAMLCGLSSLIFSMADSWGMIIFSRFLIGVGSAVGFLGVSKIVSTWFKPESYAKIIGFSFSIGLCGAIYGGRPVTILIENFGWQKISMILAVVAFIIGFTVLLFLRDKPVQLGATDTVKDSLKISDFRNLLKMPAIWILALSNLLMVGTLEGFADVWGPNYLMVAYNMPKAQAAELTSIIFVGMIFGGPILAMIARKYDDYIVLIACGMLMGIVFCSLLLFKQAFNYYLLAATFWLLGVLCCYQVIMFSAGANLVSDLKLIGVVAAFLNSINMLGGSFFHTIIGFMMDKFSVNILLADGTKQYDLASYDTSLMIIPICSIIGSILIFFIKVRGFKMGSENSAL